MRLICRMIVGWRGSHKTCFIQSKRERRLGRPHRGRGDRGKRRGGGSRYFQVRRGQKKTEGYKKKAGISLAGQVAVPLLPHRPNPHFFFFFLPISFDQCLNAHEFFTGCGRKTKEFVSTGRAHPAGRPLRLEKEEEETQRTFRRENEK